MENSLDACELHHIPPDIFLRISSGEERDEGGGIYQIRIVDNGSGVPARHIPSAFAQVFYGSKYRLRQSRGTFGMGGTMALLYGQITTNSSVRIVSSTGTKTIHEYELMVDIQRNRPIILKHKTYNNEKEWHGTAIELTMDGDYTRASPKLLEYLKQTAIVVPYANLTFVDPKGRLYRFEKATSVMPPPPTETKPHPYGIDVETLKRLISITESEKTERKKTKRKKSKNKEMLKFITTYFHRVGDVTAEKFLGFAGIPLSKSPKKLDNEEIVRIVQRMKLFKDFRPPEASCLSPLGEKLLWAGIEKELKPEFITVRQRPPSVYSGFPFIVEVALAYGGGVPLAGDLTLYRFANRIPLLYDEASDISWKVSHDQLNWRNYHVDTSQTPLAVFVHLCSTKIPYRSVGKEFIGEIPEIEREILNGIRDAARELSTFLSKKHAIEVEKKRLDVFEKFLPKIAAFAAELGKVKEVPDIQPLLKSVIKYGAEEDR